MARFLDRFEQVLSLAGVSDMRLAGLFFVLLVAGWVWRKTKQPWSVNEEFRIPIAACSVAILVLMAQAAWLLLPSGPKPKLLVVDGHRASNDRDYLEIVASLIPGEKLSYRYELVAMVQVQNADSDAVLVDASFDAHGFLGREKVNVSGALPQIVLASKQAQGLRVAVCLCEFEGRISQDEAKRLVESGDATLTVDLRASNAFDDNPDRRSDIAASITFEKESARVNARR